MTTPLNAIAQGIFDIVVERGSQLNRRSMGTNGVCAYRDMEGDGACFVGLLLSDEEAHANNGKLIAGSVGSLVMDGFLPERLQPHTTLLARLQAIHDNPENWEEYGNGPPDKRRMAHYLRDVATDFGLKANTVDTFFHS
jgi:hypothetical protein